MRSVRLSAMLLGVASLLSATTALGQDIIPDSEAERDSYAAARCKTTKVIRSDGSSKTIRKCW